MTILTNEQKEFLKIIVHFQNNISDVEKEFLKFTIDSISTIEELVEKIIIIKSI